MELAKKKLMEQKIAFCKREQDRKRQSVCVCAIKGEFNLITLNAESFRSLSFSLSCSGKDVHG